MSSTELHWRHNYDVYQTDQQNHVGLSFDNIALNHEVSFIEPVDAPDDSLNDNPFVDVGPHRFKTPDAKKFLEEYYFDEGKSYFKWNEHWRRFPFHMIYKNFSLEEMLIILHTDGVQSSLSEEFEYNPCYRIFHKIRNSMWHWGSGVRKYNHIVYWYKALKRFQFPIKDFEVKLDHTTHYNEFSMDIGIKIMSDQTGKVERFYLSLEEEQNEEIVAWHFKPCNRLLRTVSQVTIFND